MPRNLIWHFFMCVEVRFNTFMHSVVVEKLIRHEQRLFDEEPIVVHSPDEVHGYPIPLSIARKKNFAISIIMVNILNGLNVGDVAMITERSIEQARRAKNRFNLDKERREERLHHLLQFLRKDKKADYKRIDDSDRINARADMLGIKLADGDVGEASDQRLLERILAGDDLQSSDFLRVGARVASCVGRIHIRNRQRRRVGFGTGFMISPRLAMTNNHVLEAAANGANSMIEFDFVEGLVESVQRSRFFSLDPETFFLTSPGLDYTIIALGADYDDAEARRRGWLSLIETSGKVVVGERLNIIQHPRGGPQKVGLRQNKLESVKDDYLIYGTDTEAGSSGSPVCNDQWLLAALHHASVPEHDANGRFVRWVTNEGVRISRIVADARQRLRRSTESSNSLFDAAFINMPSLAADGPAMATHAGGLIEIPVRLTIQVSTDATGAGETRASVAPPTPRAEPAEADEYMDPPDGLPVFSNPRLECILVRLNESAEIEYLLEKLGEQWACEAVDTDLSPGDFDLMPLGDITVAEAWNVVHDLRSSEMVALAEPSWEIETVGEDERPTQGEAELFGFKTGPDRAAEKKRWAPDLIFAQEAWRVPLPDGGKAQGEGIRIAHPDSGYTEHKELMERPGGIDTNSAYDFVDDDTSALDKDGFHGTGTASVMMSGAGIDILGVAPKMTLVPMRVAQKGFLRPAPVLLRSGMRRLRKSIARAIDKDCHVISISLGWFGNTALHDVIQRAWEQNIIIVAAAGNFTGPIIVWPARYRECICMAGCDSLRGIWEGSARGSRVDFTGPAQDVWKAGFDRGRESPMQSSGTSFATAMTAGVAALWLAFHGRDNLIDRYGNEGIRLTEVFRTVIKRSADPKPRSWFGGFGGIVNAERALRTPLPELREVRRSFELEAMMEGIDIPAGPQGPSLTTALEILGEDHAEGRRRLADGLSVSEGELDTIADGCGDELAFHTILAMGQSGMAVRESLSAPTLEHSQMSERLKSKLQAR